MNETNWININVIPEKKNGTNTISNSLPKLQVFRIFKTETEKKNSISNNKISQFFYTLNVCIGLLVIAAATRENVCLKSKTALNLNLNINPKKSPSLQRAQKRRNKYFV